MDFTPAMAFSASQIIAVLLVATILDPWAKGSMSPAAGDRRRTKLVVGAWTTYVAKVLAVVVLLFNMQLVLFDISWHGGRGYALAVANYLALVGQVMAILFAVLSNMGAIGRASGRAEGRVSQNTH